jgi:glycosyltransferase involved in cell wall biosynthesis
MSESQWVDRPRTWWKEALKRRRIAAFSSALVGGEGHRDYLVRLGMEPSRIALGYNAVDNLVYSARAQAALRDRPAAIPSRPYFLSVCRFAPEKNLPLLVRAYAAYRERAGASAWDLVLCGGGPDERAVAEAINACRVQAQVHRPGFLQADGLAPWYAFASAFVLASLSEPWGLVVNEAAACCLPLLVSDRAGAAGTLVPDPPGTTGRRFDPASETDLAFSLRWMANLAAADRKAMGDRARAVVADWGPERFARGMLQALDHAAPGLGSGLSLAS